MPLRRLAVLVLAVLALTGPACGRVRPSGFEVWLAPNMGSPDLIEMFGQPRLWTAARRSTDVFKFYERQILADSSRDCPECGRNIYPELSRAEAFTRLNAWGLAIGIEAGDSLIDVKLTTGQNEVVLITRDGMSIRFSEQDVRPMGRPASGVRGINLENDDTVVAAAVVVPDATLLVAGENGIGKRTSFEEYRLQSRGGKGIITMKTNDKTGAVVGALTVKDEDEIMVITVGGQMVRILVQDIREAGRNTQGVRLIDLHENDKLQAIAPVISEDQGDPDAGAPPAA